MSVTTTKTFIASGTIWSGFPSDIFSAAALVDIYEVKIDCTGMAGWVHNLSTIHDLGALPILKTFKPYKETDAFPGGRAEKIIDPGYGYTTTLGASGDDALVRDETGGFYSLYPESTVNGGINGLIITKPTGTGVNAYGETTLKSDVYIVSLNLKVPADACLCGNSSSFNGFSYTIGLECDAVLKSLFKGDATHIQINIGKGGNYPNFGLDVLHDQSIYDATSLVHFAPNPRTYKGGARINDPNKFTRLVDGSKGFWITTEATPRILNYVGGSGSNHYVISGHPDTYGYAHIDYSAFRSFIEYINAKGEVFSTDYDIHTVIASPDGTKITAETYTPPFGAVRSRVTYFDGPDESYEIGYAVMGRIGTFNPPPAWATNYGDFSPGLHVCCPW